MTRIFIFAVSILLQTYSVLAQQSTIGDRERSIPYANFGIEAGLSDNYINCIFQDHKDFLWVGTNDGLNRYDGYNFTIYKSKPGQAGSLSNNIIKHITEDDKGHLWISTDAGLNVFDPTTETFKVFQHDPADPGSLDHNIVNCTYFDSSGRTWIGSFQGLNLFDPATETFKSFQYKIENPVFFNTNGENDIKAIIELDQDTLLLGSWCQGPLLKFAIKTKVFSTINLESPHNKERYCVNAFNKTPDGKIWAMDATMIYTEQNRQTFKRIKNPNIRGPYFCVLPLKDGTFAIGTQTGMYLTDAQFNIQQHFLPFANTQTNQNKNSIFTIHEDQAGDLWLGSLDNGLYYLNRQERSFKTFPRAPSNIDLKSTNNITALANDESYLWVAMRKAGLYRFHKPSESYIDLPDHLQVGLPGKESSATALLTEGEHLLVGTWGNGLAYLDVKKQAISHYSPALINGDTKGNFIADLKKNPNGGYYLATVSGIWYAASKEALLNNRWKLRKDLASDPNSINATYTICIQVLKSGKIAFGSKAGLAIYDETNNKVAFYQHDPKDTTTLSSPIVNDIFEDQSETLWIATNNGLNKFDKLNASFLHFGKKMGLQNEYVTSITEDENGFLWLGTKSGISKYDPGKEEFINYDNGNGLLGNQFSQGALLFSPEDGKIYAGGKKGLSFFHPNRIKKNIHVPKISINQIKIYRTKKGKTKEQILPGAIYRGNLVLNYQETMLQLELSALNFRNTENNQYAYRLEGLNQDWISLGNKRDITLTNLDPGSYTLWIKGSNNDGFWSPETLALKIKVRPPWWRSDFAYFCYCLLVIGSILLTYRILLKRQELKLALAAEQAAGLRLKELDHFKSKLYTNLTHEFRTPLTVIIGMIQRIQEKPKQFLEEGAKLIESNGKNLLQLVNQLLDLSKLEDKAFQLQLQQADIIRYLRYLTESFKTYANGQNLSLRFFSRPQQLIMDFDAEQIKQIISNLISNAIKFTPSGGEIQLRVDQKERHLIIEVIDNGIGIAANHIDRIFDRFYQVDDSSTKNQPGTGIGLAHTYELVQVMQGDIAVKSQLKQGTQFIISLPIQNSAPLIEATQSGALGIANFPSLEAHPQPNVSTESQTANKHLIDLLIIEDNPDVVLYLKACLADQFNLHVAYNGKIGVEQAQEMVPDIIISDVMMPEMNGYEVCKTLKADIRTSHIPIILLTAKADKPSKIHGFEIGADAYLFKPFEKSELFVRLNQLLDKQRRILSHFKQKYQTGELRVQAKPSIEQSALVKENDFLQKVIRVIDQNYTDETFALPQLCQKMGMSRSQIFRKMKALTGHSPSYFIRHYRLNKAKDLLEQGQHNVSEVAYQVGFKELAHFSKAYKEAFGYPASATRK